MARLWCRGIQISSRVGWSLESSGAVDSESAERRLAWLSLNTLPIVHDSTIVSQKQRKYGKALEWHRRTLTMKEESLGTGHPDPLTTAHNMAVVLSNQGKRGEALE